jgi:anti-sigma factor RsiW
MSSQTNQGQVCPEYEPLIADRLTGELDAAGVARLASHLDACAGCRAEAQAFDEALALAKLPSPGVKAEAAPRDLAGETLRAYRFAERRRSVVRRTLVAGLAAAAVVLMVLAPAFLGQVGPASRLAASAWSEPNLDALWAKSALVVPAARAAGDEVAASEGPIFAEYDGSDDL